MTSPNTTESRSIPAETWSAARDLSRRIIELSEGCGCNRCINESTALIAVTIHNAVMAERERQWQPIETAPKDRTRLLVARFADKPADKNGYMCVDWWRDHKRDDVSYTGFGGFNKHYWPATHWMPLPAPPKAGGE